MLSEAQLKLADHAIAKVQAATSAAREAVNQESSFLSWITQSQSGRDARLGALAQQEKVLGQLRRDRTKLQTDADLAKLLKFAADVADVKTILEDAQRMTAAGFNREVVQPTLKSFSFGLGGIVTLAAVAFGAWLWLRRA